MSAIDCNPQEGWHYHKDLAACYAYKTNIHNVKDMRDDECCVCYEDRKMKEKKVTSG